MRKIASPLSGFDSPFGRRGDDLSRVISLLFGASEPGFLFVADPRYCFTDTAGTTNAAVGQAVAYWKDLSGRNNHATQATTANRPILGRKPKGGRRNRLRSSEDGTGAAWARTGTTVDFEGFDEDGFAIQKITFSGSSANSAGARLFAPFIVGDAREQIMIRADAPTQVRRGQRNNEITQFVGGTIDVTTDWQLVTTNRTGSGTGLDTVSIVNNADGDALPVYIKRWQIEEGTTVTAPQRTRLDGFDVTEPGKTNRHYLFFGGASDPKWLQTPTITPGTDKVQVFAGVRKLGEAADGASAVLNHVTANFNAGGFELFARTGVNNLSAVFGRSTEGATGQAGVTTNIVAPISYVQTGIVDYAQAAGSEFFQRINQAVTNQTTGLTQENTGTFGTGAVWIGSRGGTLVFLNGEISALTGRFGPNLTTEQIELVERFTASKVAEETI